VQAIATGIGFLGAGTIFVSGRRHQVHGLTTAASIWVIAAVGVAVGCDRFLLATGASVLTLIILHLLVKLEPPQRSLADDPEFDTNPKDAVADSHGPISAETPPGL
jgi:putative Mg2+ transporter-C (MgtC) family protein